MQKGPTLPADAIVIDLEDSVAPDAKESARESAKRALTSVDYGRRLRVVRINHRSTDWYAHDLAMLADAKPDAVLVPKVGHPSDVEDVDRHLSSGDSESSIEIWAMLETIDAVVNARSICAAREHGSRLSTLCIGNNDLAREAGMRITSERTLLIPWLMELVLAAKSQQLNILDGVYNDFADMDGFQRECIEGAAMGMNGKTLIHPSQIAPANTAYSPSEQDIKHAQEVVRAFALEQNAGAGVVQIDGRMVERLHLDMARHTLEIAKRIESLS